MTEENTSRIDNEQPQRNSLFLLFSYEKKGGTRNAAMKMKLCERPISAKSIAGTTGDFSRSKASRAVSEEKDEKC